MSDDIRQREHEQTIEPIKPGFGESRAAETHAFEPISRKSPQTIWLAGGGIGLIAALAFVFFGLPRWLGEQREPAGEPALPAPVETPANPEASLSEARKAELDAGIQRDLASLLTQQNHLETLSVADWGGEAWERYQSLSRGGDDAYLAKDLEAAAEAYANALTVGQGLLDQADQIVAGALERGWQAIEARDPAKAIEQFNIVLSIEDSTEAEQGRLRAQRLPQVLDLMREGESHEDSGDLPAAIEAYKGALAIDREWQPAREALTAAQSQLADYEFEQLLSRGYSALAESKYKDAIEQFEKALAMRPGTPEAKDGLYQAEQGQKLGQIALAEVRALAFERRELWPQAIAQYQSALATDPTLQTAIDGLARAQARQDLDAKIVNIVDNPRLLFDDQVLAQANALLEDAQGIENRGQRIEDQIASLSRLIRLATTPQRVVLESDALTEVTIYRVGTLGTFTATELELRPGEYTAIGSRNGYRDVRMRFTVLPGQALEPIRVVCIEPI